MNATKPLLFLALLIRGHLLKSRIMLLFILFFTLFNCLAQNASSHNLKKDTVNGNGISQKVLDKIFQPFFTTKPTGQGTGLGLSLSYDIVKANGGELKVETKECQGSEFVIQLPLT